MKLLNVPSENDCFHSAKKEFQRSAIAVHPAHLKDNLEPVFLSCMDPSHKRNFHRKKRHSGLQGRTMRRLQGLMSRVLQALFSSCCQIWLRHGKQQQASNKASRIDLELAILSCMNLSHKIYFHRKEQDSILTQAGRGRKCNASRDLYHMYFKLSSSLVVKFVPPSLGAPTTTIQIIAFCVERLNKKISSSK